MRLCYLAQVVKMKDCGNIEITPSGDVYQRDDHGSLRSLDTLSMKRWLSISLLDGREMLLYNIGGKSYTKIITQPKKAEEVKNGIQ